MFGHWAGFYSQGKKTGFEHAKGAITAINTRFKDKIIWQKSSEMARYEAARQLTKIARAENKLTLSAPIPCPDYTLKVAKAAAAPPTVAGAALTEVREALELKAGTFVRDKDAVTVCFDLAKGDTTLVA
jgi:hypothetical protein